MIRRCINFTPEMWNNLKKEAKEKGMTVSTYIRIILSERNK